MYCERCRNIEATIHLTEIIKEVKSEVHLCEECARQIGLNSKLSDFRLSVPEMLSFLELDEIDDPGKDEKCRVCGTSCIDCAKSGILGCVHCYSAFGDHIMPVIRRLHADGTHIGKSPGHTPESCGFSGRSGFDVINRENIKELSRLLDNAVSEERYEEAAELRDKIKSYGIE